jgi:hypothetical protein
MGTHRNPKNPFEKVYSADFVLLFISFSIPFGWTMSGFAPSIVWASVCWAITILVVMHCLWVWTKKWWTTIRLLIVFAVPATTVSVFWNPVKAQYILERHPQPAYIQKQWYIHLKYLDFTPPLSEPLPFFFRVGADVNDQSYSFPVGTLFYTGTPGRIDMVDSAPLPPSGRYIVDFKLWVLTRQFLRVEINNPYFKTNSMAISSTKVDTFEAAGLPALGTNHIFLPLDYQEDMSVVYEIATSR